MDTDDLIMEPDDLIKEWFINHDISPLNIYTVSMMLAEQKTNKKGKEKLEYSILLYPKVLDCLIRYNKIDENDKDKFINLFKFLCEHDNIEMYASILIYISNHPNLLNNKWTINTKYRKIKTKCFPCTGHD